jgi:hypothetical protein
MNTSALRNESFLTDYMHRAGTFADKAKEDGHNAEFRLCPIHIVKLLCVRYFTQTKGCDVDALKTIIVAPYLLGNEATVKPRSSMPEDK